MTTPVIEIQYDAKGMFRSRSNRFLGIVDITSPKIERAQNMKVHVHDPGRLIELLYPGNQVILRKAHNTNRKTKWDLIAANFNRDWILVHSGFHRHIAEWVLKNPRVSPFGKVKEIKAEVTFGNSRLDFLLTKKNEKKIWVEVKGCTLARDGIALFPDAPTKRGRKHIQALISAKERGAESAILMLIFRPDAQCFSPNSETDFQFSRVFYSALDVGVDVHPLLFRYGDGMIHYIRKIPLCEHTSSG